MLTVAELAAKLEDDGRNHPKKRIRRKCTPERCARVAARALQNPQADEKRLVEMCASEEPEESREKQGPVDPNGFGFAWLALLLPLLQLVLQFLANRAKAHMDE